MSKKIYAKCAFKECENKATWVMGTWQCCDKCAKMWITEEGYSPWGTSRRIGQKAILKHNQTYHLDHFIVKP
jgi:hypothetical protein